MPTISKGTSTPWGPADTVYNLGGGIFIVDTPGHGGLYVPDNVKKDIPPKVVNAVFNEAGWNDNWAEEDCNLPIAIAFVFHHLDPNALATAYPYQPRITDHNYWREAALRTARAYPEHLSPCIPFLEAQVSQQSLAR